MQNSVKHNYFSNGAKLIKFCTVDCGSVTFKILHNSLPYNRTEDKLVWMVKKKSKAIVF